MRVPEHVLVRQVDDELVLLNLDNEEYYGLDEVGAAMWSALTSTPSLETAVNRLLDRYEVDAATLTRDLDRLVRDLNDRGLVELDPS